MTLIRPSDLTPSQVIMMLEEAQYPTGEARHQGQWIGSAFFEPSTRTKLSFHAAARDDGWEVLDLPDASASSLTKGETAEDTIRNMIEIADLRRFVLRTSDEDLIHRMAEEYPEVLFINGGNGKAHHPTQALGDLLTLAEHFGGWGALNGKTVTIVGDLTASRVANSCRELFTMFGINVQAGGPQYYTMPTQDWKDTHRCSDLEEALDTSDVIMSLRIQHERMRVIPTSREEKIAEMLEWSVTEAHLVSRPSLRIMHPGPVNRGVELTDGVVDGMQSLILRQVRAGYQMRRALLNLSYELFEK